MEFEKLTNQELKKCIITGTITLNNGETRKFDLLDFYLMSNVSSTVFLEQVKKGSTVDEIKKITQFFSLLLDKKGQIQIIGTNDLLDIKYSCKGRVLTIDEKKQIIKFLNSNLIPINQATYLYAIRKYYAGIIDIYNCDVAPSFKPKTKTRKKGK